jgi:LDH2 family malate/lactate/ureidoglycolate dehydrogenase
MKTALPDPVPIKIETLKKFVISIFNKLDVPKNDAAIVADVLISSDRRGIASHGVARLQRYVTGLKKGVMKPQANSKIVKETATTARIDGGAGLGQVISHAAMQMAIEKAKEHFLSTVVVENSNHFGIAGYYAMMAIQEGMIGISLTNSGPLVVPTFGKQALIGTNPISVAVPSQNERPYVLDMATSIIPSGKLEVYRRRDKEIPESWAVDEMGNISTDPGLVLDNVRSRKGGGLLPLGGFGELNSGHKGYGLGVLVDILTGVLSGGAFGLDVYGKSGEPANVCHFFAVINIEAFMALDIFTERMDKLIRMLKTSEKATGETRIYIHGEKEWEMMEKQQEIVNIEANVLQKMKEIAKDVGVNCPF